MLGLQSYSKVFLLLGLANQALIHVIVVFQVGEIIGRFEKKGFTLKGKCSFSSILEQQYQQMVQVHQDLYCSITCVFNGVSL